MLAIIGIVVVIGAILGGFIWEKGHLAVLMQPAELLIIGGAAIGSFLIASPMSLVKGTAKKLILVFKAKELTAKAYLPLLTLVFEILALMRKDGAVAVEDHVNHPEKSQIFSKYDVVMKDHETLDFICDNIKVLISGNVEPKDFDAIMDIDLESREDHADVIPSSLNKVADSLPGMGIVAAVLGVVVTMGKINEPPEVLGHSVGAALVGTFLGILACYGFLGPMAAKLEHIAHANHVKLKVIRTALAVTQAGMPPSLAVEAARRAIPEGSRPSFAELEDAIKLLRKAQGGK
jgi:chemotaxis protein MotA